MPTYAYKCTNPECAHTFDVVQAFTDSSLTECPVCGQTVRKVFSPVGVVFKGSGFYRNDSRGTSESSEKADAKGSSDKGSEKGSDKGSSDKGSSESSSSGSEKSSGTADKSSSSSDKGSSSSGSGSSSGSSSGSGGSGSGGSSSSSSTPVKTS